MTVTTPAMRTAFHLSTVLPVRYVPARQRSEPAPMRRPHVDPKHRRILALRKQGLSLNAIAKRIPCSKATAWRHISRP